MCIRDRCHIRRRILYEMNFNIFKKYANVFPKYSRIIQSILVFFILLLASRFYFLVRVPSPLSYNNLNNSNDQQPTTDNQQPTTDNQPPIKSNYYYYYSTTTAATAIILIFSIIGPFDRRRSTTVCGACPLHIWPAAGLEDRLGSLFNSFWAPCPLSFPL